MIEYNPIDTDIKSQYLNVVASGGISMEIIPIQYRLKFALFSDVHENYDDMTYAVQSIKAKPDLQFAVSHN
jgi:hypothetical protein